MARYFDLYVNNKMRFYVVFVATSRYFKGVQSKTALYPKSGFNFPIYMMSNTWNCVGRIYIILHCCSVLERMVSSSKTPSCGCSLYNFNPVSELGLSGHPLSFSSNKCLQTFLFVIFIRHRIPRMDTVGNIAVSSPFCLTCECVWQNSQRSPDWNCKGLKEIQFCRRIFSVWLGLHL